MDKIKLKPCPFCGSEAVYFITGNYNRCVTNGWKFGIKCPNCMVPVAIAKAPQSWCYVEELNNV